MAQQVTHFEMDKSIIGYVFHVTKYAIGDILR
jgi:hypothetical protein